MGKTKTAFVGGLTDEKMSSEEKYKQKLAKKKAEESATTKVMADKGKAKVKGLGLKGGARIKVIGAEVPEEVGKVDQVLQVEQVEQVEKAGEATKEKKIRVRGKNYKTAKAKTDRNKLYSISDALKLIKSLSFTKFDETYELHILAKKTGLNFSLTLPHTFGKTKKVEVASDETVEKLKKASSPKSSGPGGKIDFDVLLATPEMMPKLVMFAKLLGPRGLMPNPKNGTLIKSVKEAEKYSASQTVLKTEKEQPVMHTTVGKMSMKEGDVAENIHVILDTITKANIVKVYLKSTMSPSIKLQV